MAEVTYEPRVLNDLSSTVEGEADPRMDMGMGEFDVEQYRASVQSTGAMEMFYCKVIDHLEELRTRCEEEREGREFSRRMDENRRRAKNAFRARYLADGSMDPKFKDGGSVMGIQQGLTLQACSTSASYINSTIFASVDRFFDVRGRGRRVENRRMEDGLAHVGMDLARRGGLENMARLAVEDAPRMGTSVLRYYMSRPVETYRDEGGVWRERLAQLTPVIQRWPVEDHLVTQWGEPDPAKQEGVFWIRRNATVHELEADEAVYEAMTETGPMGEIVRVYRAEGRFTGLNKLRDSEQGLSDRVARSSDDVTDERIVSRVSNFPTFDLIEYEGRLPLYAWVMDGTLTWDVAQYFGINVPVAPFAPEDEAAKREFGRWLNKIAVWNVTYAVDTDRSDVDLTRCLFEFSDSVTQRNTLYKLRYMTESDAYLGLSVRDVGCNIEDMHDRVVNAFVRIADHNSNPSWLADLRIVKSQLQSDINRLLGNPGTVIPKTPGIRRDEALEALFYQPVPDLPQVAAMLQQYFEAATGVLAAAKGTNNPQTRTATELKLDDAKSRALLDDIVLCNARELNRLVADMIKDAWMFEGKDGFVDYATRVAGYDAAGLYDDIESADGIWKEFEIVSPMTVGRDKTVMAMTIERANMAFPGVIDPRRGCKAIVELGGYRQSEELMGDDWEVLEPEEEHRMLKAGNVVTPSPKMSPDVLMLHIAAHEAEILAVHRGQVEGLSEEMQDAYYLALVKLRDTDMQLMNQLMMQMQMAASMGGGPGPERKEGPSQPVDEARMNNTAQSQSPGIPGAGMQVQAEGMIGG